MPYLAVLDDRARSQFRNLDIGAFFNLDASVGERSHNQRNDVKLVQFLLKLCYRSNDVIFTILAQSMPEENLNVMRAMMDNEMVVDGVYGPVTRRWLLGFQHDMQRKQAGLVYADGRLDPVRPDAPVLPGHRTYGLLLLNNYAARTNPQGFALTIARVPMTARPG